MQAQDELVEILELPGVGTAKGKPSELCSILKTQCFGETLNDKEKLPFPYLLDKSKQFIDECVFDIECQRCIGLLD